MAPKLGDRPVVITEQGRTVERAFDAIGGTINSITAAVVFSYSKPSSYREAAKE
jgi:hypothetical protein